MTFLNEAAELIESFTCRRRRFVFALQTLHADHNSVKSSNRSLVGRSLTTVSHRYGDIAVETNKIDT